MTAVAKVAKQGTAAEQYARAKMFGPDDAAAWQAVLEHFPGEIAWTQRARVELAFLHLRDRRWEEAEKAFNDLAANGDDQSIKANALAGKAILASIRGNPDESQRIMADELLPVRQHLDPDVARLVFETIERNRKALGNKIDKRFDELFQGAPGNG